MDALVIRDAATGRRLAAAWSELQAYEKLMALPEQGRGTRVDRVQVSGRRRDVQRRLRTLREAGDKAPPLPPGYEVRRQPALAAATLRARPWQQWRRELEAVVRASPNGEWVPAGSGFAGSYGTDTNALAARGMIEIAGHRWRSNLYRSTRRGRRAVSGN